MHELAGASPAPDLLDAGGSIRRTASPEIALGVGGDITLTVGDGDSGSGGAIEVRAGDTYGVTVEGEAAVSGGCVAITAGSSGTSMGGVIDLISGFGEGGPGGNIQVSAGGAAGFEAQGANVTITAGMNSVADTVGGAITMTGGFSEQGPGGSLFAGPSVLQAHAEVLGALSLQQQPVELDLVAPPPTPDIFPPELCPRYRPLDVAPASTEEELEPCPFGGAIVAAESAELDLFLFLFTPTPPPTPPLTSKPLHFTARV